MLQHDGDVGRGCFPGLQLGARRRPRLHDKACAAQRRRSDPARVFGRQMAPHSQLERWQQRLQLHGHKRRLCVVYQASSFFLSFLSFFPVFLSFLFFFSFGLLCASSAVAVTFGFLRALAREGAGATALALAWPNGMQQACHKPPALITLEIATRNTVAPPGLVHGCAC